MRSIRRALLSLAVILTAAAGMISCASPVASTPREQAVIGWQKGNKAPNFSLSGPDGKAVSLSDLAGKPVLINFWASW